MFIDGQFTAAGAVITVTREIARDMVASERADLVPGGDSESDKAE